MKKTKIQKSKQVGVSPKAHELMKREAFKSKPRKNLRQYINKINNLPEEA